MTSCPPRWTSLGFASLAALAVVGALAGCSSSSGSSGGASPASAGSSSAAGGSTSTKLDICTLLPLATVVQLSGADLSTAKPDNSLDANGIYACDYENADDTAFIRVDVNNQSAKIAYDANYSAHGSTDDLSGLGDKAFGTMYNVEALFGSTDIHVTNQTLAGTDALTAIVLKVHSSL